jgi:hypothetical protein
MTANVNGGLLPGFTPGSTTGVSVEPSVDSFVESSGRVTLEHPIAEISNNDHKNMFFFIFVMY